MAQASARTHVSIKDEQASSEYFLQEQQVQKQPAPTGLQHLSELTIKDTPKDVRNTSIVCTLGPASESVDNLQKLISAGMNIARLNMSHGTHEYHAKVIKNLREALGRFDTHYTVGIALDTRGPEIRTGALAHKDRDIELVNGASIRLMTNERYREGSTENFLFVDYPNIVNSVKTGSKIFIDDGLLALVVESVDDDSVLCVVEEGGPLGAHKGVNLAGCPIDLPAVSDQDIKDIKFGLSQDVDMVFASFVRDAAAIKQIRTICGDNTRIIAKIENKQGVDNADSIIAEADGIMVARGELGIEIPPEQVFLVQKMLIAKCNLAGKSVICATQMLESMVTNPRPTRAEGSDVANAVLDGADCVMLSGETARGKLPVQTVKIMHRICREAEAAVYRQRIFEELIRNTPKPTDTAHTVAIAATSAASFCQAAGIIIITTTGRSAELVSRYKPYCPVIAVTRNRKAAAQMHLYRSVFPLYYATKERLPVWTDDVDKRIAFGMDTFKSRGFLHVKDKLVVITGWQKGAGYTNTLRIIDVP